MLYRFASDHFIIAFSSPESPVLQLEDLKDNPLYEWLTLNPDWVGVSILLIAFVESFAILGIIVPGVAFLGVAAFLAGSGLLSLNSALLLAFCGAILGDGSSFLIGHRFKSDIRAWPVLRSNQQWVNTGEAFFNKHGIKSIVVGRFIGPIRPIMPLVAGSLGMPMKRFFSVNALSAILWAPVYVVPGFALGASLDLALTPMQLSLAALLVISVLVAFFYGIRHTFKL